VSRKKVDVYVLPTLCLIGRDELIKERPRDVLPYQTNYTKSKGEAKARYCIFSILFVFNHCINEGVSLPITNSIVPCRLLLSY
jgi:hypothetical protein